MCLKFVSDCLARLLLGKLKWEIQKEIDVSMLLVVFTANFEGLEMDSQKIGNYREFPYSQIRNIANKLIIRLLQL